MRRMPVFFVIDVSESMAGDNLREMEQGLLKVVSQLREDPYALETAFLSLIVFAGKSQNSCSAHRALRLSAAEIACWRGHGSRRGAESSDG